MRARTIGLGGLAATAALVGYDLTQKRHAILRNFPVIGHLRFILEAIGPELRQYIVTDNDEERPFTRDQRRWVYTSSKSQDSHFGFGTDNHIDEPDDYLIIKHRPFVVPGAESAAAKAVLAGSTVQGVAHDAPLACGKVLGGPRGRRLAHRPSSVINVSAMSFGALSGAAIEALNRGALLAGCTHNTGEGGISPHHRHGADLVLQVGTAYFGCRDEQGRFDLARLVDVAASAPVRAIEVKLSQGAKPGLGGLLPGPKVTAEISVIRGIPIGVDCHSPPRHSAFSDVAGLVDLLERIAAATGLPVGIKSAVGEHSFWHDLAEEVDRSGGGPDFITIDGGEGGTGAAPLVFADHIALPFTVGFARAHSAFAERGLADDVVWIGSGKLGLPDRAVLAFALGADLINVAREAMLAIGCIQSQRCHTGRCPTGVATQSPWLMRGLDPTDKAVRLAGFVAALRHEVARVATAVGVAHPAQITLDDIDLLVDANRAISAREAFGYEPGWGAATMS